MTFIPYIFEARFGGESAEFPTERKARQWVADQLGIDPSEELYGIWEINSCRSHRRPIWISPESRFGIGEGLDLLTDADRCQVCGDEAALLDQEVGPVCEECQQHLENADALLRSLAAPLNSQPPAFN